ncbi:MAG: hypothetical protein H5U40_06030 [Polyangiaceae bacterium]|nr:hypothetical protein [Polyangiaceae bacterium]
MASAFADAPPRLGKRSFDRLSDLANGAADGLAAADDTSIGARLLRSEDGLPERSAKDAGKLPCLPPELFHAFLEAPGVVCRVLLVHGALLPIVSNDGSDRAPRPLCHGRVLGH